MKILLHPTYFGSIAQYVAIAKASSIIFEGWDNYQKQTYRNRTIIYGANGALNLNLPIVHTKKEGRQLYKDVQIAHQFNTLNNHWKSLEAAYRTSPYFEFYEDELRSLFEGKPKFLFDFNYKTIEFIFEALQLEIEHSKTESYQLEPIEVLDYRNLVIAKNKDIGSHFSSYIQVFNNKHGFLPNLSILDLLFNEGPNTLSYLESQDIFNSE